MLYTLERRRCALMELPPTLPADVIMRLTERDLDRLYAASLSGKDAYYACLAGIVQRQERRSQSGKGWNGVEAYKPRKGKATNKEGR
jgi:hypothetical protein